MATLARGDTERLLRFAAEADDLAGDDPFPPEFLTELGRLVAADAVWYSELDRVRRRVIVTRQRPGDLSAPEAEPEIQWRVFLREHPVCLRHDAGWFGTLKLSDFFTRRQLHRSWIYHHWFRPIALEDEVHVAIPSPGWHTKNFALDRNDRDFTERDRLVLDLVQPHLARVWRAAQTRRRLAAALAGLERTSQQDQRGIVILTRSRQAEFTSPAAQRILRDFFPGTSEGALPAIVAEWLDARSDDPLVARRGDRQVAVERSGDALLLEEKRDADRLTARETEVVTWVAQGKTTAEIARILSVAPGTVRKHLENVYAKLGVSTRAAAVGRLLGA